MVIWFRVLLLPKIFPKATTDCFQIFLCSIFIPTENNHHVQKMIVEHCPQLWETCNHIFPAFAQLINPIRNNPLRRNRRIHDTGSPFAIIVDNLTIPNDFLCIHNTTIGEIFVINFMACFKENLIKQ